MVEGLEVVVERIGPMPPYYLIADVLWGKDRDIDSDGDSSHPDDLDWSELTLVLRADGQRLEIDPLGNDRWQLRVKGSTRALVEKAIEFLRSCGAVR